MRQYLKKIKMLWRDTAGNMVPLAVAATIGMLFIILGVSEYMRLVITAAGVKDAVESAVVSTVNDNYNEVYHGVREGYAAGYEPDGEGFAAAVDYGDIYGRLCFLSVLRRTGKVMSDSIMMAGGSTVSADFRWIFPTRRWHLWVKPIMRMRPSGWMCQSVLVERPCQICQSA